MDAPKKVEPFPTFRPAPAAAPETGLPRTLFHDGRSASEPPTEPASSAGSEPEGPRRERAATTADRATWIGADDADEADDARTDEATTSADAERRGLALSWGDATPAPSTSTAVTPPADDDDGGAVLLELKCSALATDIERVGDRLVLTETRIELRGSGKKLKGAIALGDVRDLELTKARAGFSARSDVRVSSDDTELLLKGANPGQAADFAAHVRARSGLGEAPIVTDVSLAHDAATDALDAETAAHLRQLEELHAAGILTDEEFTAKRDAILGSH